ncbi:MAG: class I SAM-dependent methyltransferase [Candidatus Spechtbacteria bacterium]|nr:class I SAM-dependent methyltransferase [Candidatus Spechtbacteria bacterium]
MVKTRFDFLKLHMKGPRILDVGNLGDDEYDEGKTHRMIQSAFSNFTIIGLDMNEEKAKKLSFPNQVVGSAEAMPFPSDFFDTIYMGEILEHTFEPQKMIKEARRTLKNGGILILDTPNPYALSRIFRFLVKKMDTLGHSDHKVFYTPCSLKNILEENEFHIEAMVTDSTFGVKGRTFFLPRIPFCEMLGGHICVKAIKL